MTGPPRDDVAISARGVSKTFEIPHEQVHTLKERALHPFRRRTFEVLHALRDVDFEVRQGEFYGVVGRNGSGKSTLMKCLAGIYKHNAGSIWMRGRLAPFIELGVGFNAELTARDNVLINAIMLGLTPAEARRRYDSIVAFAELEDFVDLKLKNYSSGMQVRLAFSVMTHVDADVLLIDEVLAVGDAAFQQKCHDALNAAHDEGRTIVLVTHDVNAVQRFCDRAMLIDEGRIVEIGDPRTVAGLYEQVNFRRGTVDATLPAHLGSGGAAILEAWFEDADGSPAEMVANGTRTTLRVVVEFREPVEDPVFGVVISDERHQPVWAAESTWVLGWRSGSFPAGERVEVSIGFDNVLANGRYFASPEVKRGGPHGELLDHRENAASLVVGGARDGAGQVDLIHDFTIERARVPAERAAG